MEALQALQLVVKEEHGEHAVLPVEKYPAAHGVQTPCERPDPGEHLEQIPEVGSQETQVRPPGPLLHEAQARVP